MTVPSYQLVYRAEDFILGQQTSSKLAPRQVRAIKASTYLCYGVVTAYM